MKKLNKCIIIIDRIINLITILFFIVILFMGSYALYDAHAVYSGGLLTDELKRLRPLDEETEFSLNNLQEINEDICAWIRMDDTHIDYPVVVAENNEEYLNLDYKKDFSTAGSIFLDYRNDKDFTDNYMAVYGHNMEADLMFSDVKNYTKKGYFNNHLTGTLFTSKAIYHIEVICASYADAYSSQVYNVTMLKNMNPKTIVNNFKKMTKLYRDIEINDNDKLLLLSTCDSIGSNDRLVVLAKLIKKDGNNIINEGNKALLTKMGKEQYEAEDLEIREQSSNPQVKIHEFIRKIPIRYMLLTLLLIVIIIIFSIAAFKYRKYSKGKHSVEKKE